MNLLENHPQPLVSAYLRASLLQEDLPQSFSSLVLLKSVCLPLSFESLAFSIHLMAQKRLTQGKTDHICFSGRFSSINVTFDDIFRDHVVLFDLVDRLALPEFLHLVSKPFPHNAPVVLVENLLLALLELNVSFSLIKKRIFRNWSCLSRFCLLSL